MFPSFLRFASKNRHVLTAIFCYVLSITVFTLFRIITLIVNFDKAKDIPEGERLSILTSSFVLGWRFDTVVFGYVIILPFVILWSTAYHDFKWKSRLVSFSLWFTTIAFLLAFFISSADIPYFQHFYNRLNVSAFQWNESPLFVVKMIFEEPRYWWPFIPFIAIAIPFVILLRRHFRKIGSTPVNPWLRKEIVYSLFFSILVSGIIFLGIRGRIERKSPIRVGMAYFSNYAFANLLALNPVYTLERSFSDSKDKTNRAVSLMPDSLALQRTRMFLSVPAGNSGTPIARYIKADSTRASQKLNVILVIMESMSAGKMGRYGNPDGMTPQLDSLAKSGYAFDQIYTSGIHTFNGIYSTLFAYPALFRQHPMKSVDMLKYHGLSSVLRKHDYSTIYFTTHDGQFDNVEGFLRRNDFQEVISQKDYPSEKALSTLGVPDDYMFEFSIPLINALHKKGKPFLSVFMTASDHGPYMVPDYYKPHHSELKKQTIAYADWSIGKFIRLASVQPWFENTLFVFMADHGEMMNDVYDMPLNYHHAPFILFAPKWLKPKAFENLGGQIDVFPTLMGILNLPYVNNTLGLDLLSATRPFIYFCADDKYGVLDKEKFLIVRNNGTESLHHYPGKDLANYVVEDPKSVAAMKDYAAAQMQAAQWMISNKKTEIPDSLLRGN